MARIVLKKSHLRYLLSFVIFLLGVVVGIAIRHYYNLPLAETINIVDTATLITTIFLAIYIPSVLDRQLQVRHDKRDLVSDRLDDLQSLYRRINMSVQQGTVNMREYMILRNSLDLTEHRFDTIVRLLPYLDLKVSVDEDVREIRSACKHYSELLDPLKPAGEGLEYPEDVRAREEELYGKIDRATSILMFKLNDI